MRLGLRKACKGHVRGLDKLALQLEVLTIASTGFYSDVRSVTHWKSRTYRFATSRLFVLRVRSVLPEGGPMNRQIPETS